MKTNIVILFLSFFVFSALGQARRVDIFGKSESDYQKDKTHQVVLEVQDAQSKIILEKASLVFISKSRTIRFDETLKRFFIDGVNFLEDGTLNVQVSSLGYEPKVVEINLPSSGNEVFLIVKLSKIAKKETIISLKTIQFDQSQAILKPQSFAELNNLAKTLKENTALKIEIRGHTDNVGEAALNLKLSEERCLAVKQYLIKKGIDAIRLNTKGFGGSQPLAPNDSEANKIKNRRVEFVIIEGLTK